MKRKPIKRHAPKRKPDDVDKAYVAWIKTLPCAVIGCIYQENGSFLSVTEAHHAGDHGLAQRAPDRTCVPLCTQHHRDSAYAVHSLGRRFWPCHGLDRDELIKRLNAVYDARH